MAGSGSRKSVVAAELTTELVGKMAESLRSVSPFAGMKQKE